jgi:hypothetical protein
MECIRDNWKDIDRYFRNTWVKIDGYGDTLFRIDYVGSSKITGNTENDDFFEIELHNHQPFNLGYVLPHKAVFQFNKRAVILQRIPAKQFKRGICCDNVSVSFTDTGTPIDLTLNVLKAYTTKQKYFSFAEAFRSKGNKLTSFALTSRMSCVKSTGVILMDTTQIAQYAHKENKIYMTRNNFRSDIMQHIAMYQDNIEVVQ